MQLLEITTISSAAIAVWLAPRAGRATAAYEGALGGGLEIRRK